MRYSDSWGYDRREEEVFPLNGFWPTPSNYEDDSYDNDDEYQPYDKYR